MPTLTVKLAPLPSEPVQQRLAETLTAVTVDTLGKRDAVTAVVFEPVPASQWWIGGRRVQKATAMLFIRSLRPTAAAKSRPSSVAMTPDPMA